MFLIRKSFVWVFFGFLLVPSAGAGEQIEWVFRSQRETAPDSGKFHTETRPQAWDAGKTAVVICDMWNDHYCRNAARRVAEMAPRMNEVITEARSRGALIIHCPSGCMEFYENTPQRKRAQEAPVVETKIPLQSWCYLNAGTESEMPVETNQPCDDTVDLRERKRFYDRQIETIQIAKEDAITDSAEAFYLMKQRGITNVVLMGVHTNMCVLGRPFGIRQLVGQGMNVVLMRDMTDTMYNPKDAPYVNHFTGNDLVFSHIERNWCPTVTSDALLPEKGGPFRFAENKRKHIVVMMGESEYHTADSLPPFLLSELGKDFQISLVYADEEKPNFFPGLDVLRDADLLLLSVRRRNLSDQQMGLIRDFLAKGKPLVGIRTASHAFFQSKQTEPLPDGVSEWRTFDPEILGGNYHGHLKPSIATFAQVQKGENPHPILEGVEEARFQTFGSLYEVRPLEEGTEVLVLGSAQGEKETQPVAWTHVSPAGGRVFYTSLGHPYDFGTAAFRTLLRNALYWAAGS